MYFRLIYSSPIETGIPNLYPSEDDVKGTSKSSTTRRPSHGVYRYRRSINRQEHDLTAFQLSRILNHEDLLTRETWNFVNVG
jgi:hypothetical protein